MRGPKDWLKEALGDLLTSTDFILKAAVSHLIF